MAQQKTETITYTDTDDLMRQAENILYREYYQSMSRDGESIKDDLIDEIKAGNIANEDAANEWLSDRTHESADGDQWVIYTHQARRLLLVSESRDAMEGELGEASNDPSQRAYWAFRTDLEEWISRNCDVAELIEEHAPKTEEEAQEAENVPEEN